MKIRNVGIVVAIICAFGAVGTMDFTDECNAHGGTVVNGECKRFAKFQAEIDQALKVDKERKARIIAEREYQHGAIFIIEQ